MSRRSVINCAAGSGPRQEVEMVPSARPQAAVAATLATSGTGPTRRVAGGLLLVATLVLGLALGLRSAALAGTAADTTTTTPAGPSGPIGGADDPIGNEQSPFCGDQDGSEPPTPPLANCPDYSLVPDLHHVQVLGSGAVSVRFDFVFREAIADNEFAVYLIDDANGSVGGVLPGDAGYASAVAARAQVVFPSGSNAFTPDVTLTFAGGDLIAFRFRGSFFSFETANPSGLDHLLGYQHNLGGWTQLAWEDQSLGDADFNDTVVNVHGPTSAGSGQSTGVCDGAGTHANSGSACQQDPVNSLTGAFTTSVRDLQLPGIGVPFAWSRSYTSSDTTVGRLGPGWTDSYATSLLVQANGDVIVHGDEGQQVSYVKQGDGSFVGAPGALSTLSTVSGGYELVRRDQVTYLFTTQGRLTSMKDRNDQGLTFAYDGSGNLQTITDSVGRQIAATFVSGLLSRVTLPDSRYVEYSYTAGRLSSVRDTRGGITQYTYDAAGRVKTIVDQNLHTVVDNTYGADGRVTQQVNARGKVGTFAWNAGTQTSTYTDARLNQWKDVYAGNLLVERSDPLGNTARFEYDAGLNVKKVTDPRGNATTMTYDARANLLTRTVPAPLSYLETWTYNALNDPLTYTDRRGNLTDFGYDAAGNLTSVTEPDPDGPGPLGRPQTLYGRDPGGTGLLASITDPRGKQTTFTYASGNLTEIRTQLGNRTTLCYDGTGRLIGLVDPRGTQSCALPNDHRWTYTYDEAGHLLTQSDPLTNLTTLVYDPAGNLTSRTDANLRATTYAYDAANNVLSVTAPDPDGVGPLLAPVTQYTYDDVGNLATRKDANLRDTLYEYDTANRLARVTGPLSRVWTYAYDQNGNATQMVDANGNATPATGDGQTTYAYDVLNRLTSIDYSDTTPDATFAYDGNDNRTQLTDGSGTETYSHDTLDRLTAVTRGANTFSYAYDLANLTQRTYPGAAAITYTYDDDNRLQTAVNASLSTSYSYDAAGNVISTVLPSVNGHVETRVYDRAGRVTEVKNERTSPVQLRSRFVISRDPVGKPLQIVRTGALVQTQTYTYDAIDRVTSVCFQAGTCPGASDPFIRWSYDGVGNRLSETRSTGTTSYTYNAADELLSAGATSYTYDQNGNELTAGSSTFTYDLANRVKTAIQGTTTTTYSYDADGKRLQASTGSANSAKTNFLWDVSHGLPQVAQERNGANTLQRQYIYGLKRIRQTQGTGTYYLYDGLGSVANTTAPAGALQKTYSYEPYGAIRTETGSSPTNFFHFTGEYRDPTGLYHLRARQYDPGSGRFLGRDPLCRRPGASAISRYSYADDMPTELIDPSGMTPEEASACGVVTGTTLEGISIGVASAVGDFISGVDRAAERASEALPPHIRSIPRVGETLVKRAVPTITVATAVYEACAYHAQGESWGAAIGRSTFENGGAVAGATALPLACLALAPTGVGAIACVGGLAVVGGVGGHEVGGRLWDWIS